MPLLAGVQPDGMFLYLSAASGSACWRRAAGNYYSSFGNDLSFAGNVVLMCLHVELGIPCRRVPRAKPLAGRVLVALLVGGRWPPRRSRRPAFIWSVARVAPPGVVSCPARTPARHYGREMPESMSAAILMRNLVRSTAGGRGGKTSRWPCPKGSMFGFLGPNGSGKSTPSAA